MHAKVGHFCHGLGIALLLLLIGACGVLLLLLLLLRPQNEQDVVRPARMYVVERSRRSCSARVQGLDRTSARPASLRKATTHLTSRWMMGGFCACRNARACATSRHQPTATASLYGNAAPVMAAAEGDSSANVTEGAADLVGEAALCWLLAAGACCGSSWMAARMAAVSGPSCAARASSTHGIPDGAHPSVRPAHA